MKNFKYAVMVLLAAILLSCSSDDETATISGEGNLTSNLITPIILQIYF